MLGVKLILQSGHFSEWFQDVGISGWQRVISPFNPVDFMSFPMPEPICRMRWWVGGVF